MVYDMILPAVPFIVGYLLTYSLYKSNLIKKAIHIKLWNMILFLAFLISGGAGFILIILLEWGVVIPTSQPLLYWHVELGVTLVLVTIFHLYFYRKSLMAMFIPAKRRSGREA
jgi:hypothetical protein